MPDFHFLYPLTNFIKSFLPFFFNILWKKLFYNQILLIIFIKLIFSQFSPPHTIFERNYGADHWQFENFKMKQRSTNRPLLIVIDLELLFLFILTRFTILIGDISNMNFLLFPLLFFLPRLSLLSLVSLLAAFPFLLYFLAVLLSACRAFVLAFLK